METKPNVTAQMAEERAFAIEGAIAKAIWVRSTHEAVLDGAGTRELVLTLLSALEASPCYLKAMQNGEQVFVLRQRDRAAPDAIAHWATLAEDHGCAPEKVNSAYRKAKEWRDQPLDKTKWPD